MNVFKLAAKIIARHWNYLLIYTVALGAMAILGSGAIQAAPANEFANDAPKVAIIDRDNSALSTALKDFALKDAVEVPIEDSTFALQDAAAKDLASYVLIIPEGFQRDFMEAAREDNNAPALETVVSYQGARGALMDRRVKAFVQSMYGFAAVDPGATATEVAGSATEACGNETPVELLPVESEGLSAKYVNFASFSSYALFTSSAIFIAVGLASLRRPEMRRRLTVGPVRSSSYGTQVGLACVLASIAIWALISVAGLVVFDPLGAGATLASVAVVVVGQLGIALIGAAVGFLLWQLNASDSVANGVGNIAGLACSFFSGAWIPLSVAGEGVRIAAAFTPFYWATQAMVSVSQAAQVTSDLLIQAAGEVGITFLWAAAIALVAIALGRARLREAGV